MILGYVHAHGVGAFEDLSPLRMKAGTFNLLSTNGLNVPIFLLRSNSFTHYIFILVRYHLHDLLVTTIRQ